MTVNVPELRRLLEGGDGVRWTDLCRESVNALPALLAAVEALEARHEFECGCDSPGTPSVCVGDPVDEYKPLAAFSFEEQA